MAVSALVNLLEVLPADNPLWADPEFIALFDTIKARKYIAVPRIVPITKPDPVEGFGGSDFSPKTIEARADEGYAETCTSQGTYGFRWR